MSPRRHLQRDVSVAAPPEAVFQALTDWQTQGQWMLGTRVWADGAGTGVGATINAFTGVGRVGFLDTMQITDWDPPHLVRVMHTGRVVRGPGIFEIHELPDGGSRFVWREELDLPLGRLGRAGFVLVEPMFAKGVEQSLRRFAALIESGELGPKG
jgi:hypothetical protein